MAHGSCLCGQRAVGLVINIVAAVGVNASFPVKKQRSGAPRADKKVGCLQIVRLAGDLIQLYQCQLCQRVAGIAGALSSAKGAANAARKLRERRQRSRLHEGS